MTREPAPPDAMRGDVPGIAWPPLFSSRIASLAACVHQLERSQWAVPAELEAGQYRQLALLAAHYERHSAHFRARLEQARLTSAALCRPEGLAELPPLTRQQVQATDPAIFCEALPAGHAPITKVNTSGSTGEPVIVCRTAVSLLYWQALTLRYHFWAEPDFSGRICAIRANVPRFGEVEDWGTPVSLLFRTGPGLLIDIEADIGVQLDLIERFRPDSLIVYPSNVAALLDEMDSRGLDLPELRRIRTIGESVPDELRGRVADRLGALLSDCYSSEEFGYIALQCPVSGLYHLMSETLIVEVVDEQGRRCREGETGAILVTDIHNHATPMIRYRIGDYAEVGPACPCGRGLPTLRRIAGRERNMIVKPDGTRHWPLTGYKKFRKIAPIAQYQMRQHEPDRIELRLVVERPLTAAEEAALREYLHWKLRHPFRLDFTYFEGSLPRGRNGKFEEFVRLF
ncbi:MAG TPA: AMP-binding protein [Allosphingosinicella sp.]